MYYREISTDQYSPVLGAFFGISLFMTLWFLDRVQGKAYRIQDFLSDREWHILKSEKAINNVNFMLKISCWIFFTLPVITLCFWGSGVIARLSDDSKKTSPGISILLIGFGIMSLLWGVFKIKWNRYRTSVQSTISIVFGLGCMIAYKLQATFIAEDETYFGVSAIFFTMNCVIMILLAHINNPKGGLHIKDVIEKLPEGEPLDINRQTHYDDEITKAYEDDDYLPTQAEVFEMFTINRVSKRKGLRGVFEGGIRRVFYSCSAIQKCLFSFALYSIALLLMGAYAWIGYVVQDDSGISIITMVTIIATDFLVYLYIYAKISESPAEISLHLVIFRICMFILDGEHWIYGLCLLYLYIGIFLGYHIAKLRFPFLDEVIDESVEDQDEEEKTSYDIASSPEFLFVIATIGFAIIIGVMQAIKPHDIPLPRYTIDKQSYPFYAYALFAVLLVFFSIFAILAYRVFTRQRTGVQRKVNLFVHFKEYNLLFFFLTVDYLLVCLIMIILWWATEDRRYLAVGILTPLAGCFLINAYLRFVLNDFRYLQKVEEINKFVDKHNKKVAGVQKRINKYKKQMASKTGKDVTSMKLTKEDLMELNKKKIRHDHKMSDDEDEEEEHPKEESKLIKKDVEEEPEEPEEQEEDLEYNEDDLIEDGGENEEGKGEAGKKFDDSRTKSSQVPKTHNKIFFAGFKKNLFGKVAEILTGDHKDIDFDGDYSESYKATRKFKRIKDWRGKTNSCAACLTCKLRPNDYHIIFSMIFATVILMAMGAAVSGYHETTEGVSWFAGFFHVMISFSVMARPITCNNQTNTWETILYVLSHVLFYTWGLIDLKIRFDFDPKDENEGNKFLVWYVLLIPFITFFSTCFIKWYDNDWRMDRFVIITLVCTILSGIACLVCCFIFLSAAAGGVISGIVGAIIYFCVIIRVYKKNDHFLPKWWRYANMSILFCAAICALVVGIFYDGFNSFLGWSISYGIVSAVICMDGLIEMYSDIMNADNEPIYFSPWIFPVFKYYSKRNDIGLRNKPAAKVLFALFLAYLWSFQCAAWISPFYYGISVSCLVEVLTILFVLYTITFTPTHFEDSKSSLDQLLVKRSWLEAKNDYVTTKHITTPESMITFEEIVQKRDELARH